MRKPATSLLVTVFIFCLFASCSIVPTDEHQARIDQSRQAESRLAELEERSQRRERTARTESESGDIVKVFPQARQYVQDLPTYSVEYRPVLTLFEDGSCEFKTSRYDGVAYYTGKYELSGNTIHFVFEQVNERDLNEYAPDVTFEIDGENAIYSATEDMGITTYGDIFLRSPTVNATDMPVDENVPDTVKPFKEGPCLGFVTTEAGLNLRSGPGTQYDALILIPNDDFCSVFGTSKENPDWYFVHYAGHYGFASSEYLDLGHM